VYTISGYGAMIADAVRMHAYYGAMTRRVFPGCVVADIGAGTGILSMLACRLGARHVYAIEPAGAIAVARSLAMANGFADRITFVEQFSTDAVLPERADVIVSDLRGILPFFGPHLRAIIDARQRLLQTSGHLIPEMDELWISIAEDARFYAKHVAPSDHDAFGLRMGPARDVAANTWVKHTVERKQLLAVPTRCARIDYRTVSGTDLVVSETLRLSRGGTGHGITMWFDTKLADDIGFSNAPDLPATIYGIAFFPFIRPVLLSVDDIVSLDVRAHLVGNEYVWRWTTSVADARGGLKAQFRQSTFLGTPLAKRDLHTRAPEYTPALNADAAIDRSILGMFDTGLSVRDIAERIASQFPDRFTSWMDALPRVGDLSQRYSP
jgi:protein arginine N-methyltransferase 1